MAKALKMRMTPPHPGAFIAGEIIEPFGLSVSAAARVLGVRRATLSDLLHENSRLSPEMAYRLEKAFDIDMDLLLRIQATYDVHVTRELGDQFEVERYEPA